jgi:DNA-binding XRE family transcriptional regulator
VARNLAMKIQPAFLEIRPAKFKALRKESGLTQERLCKEAGVSDYTCIARLEGVDKGAIRPIPDQRSTGLPTPTIPEHSPERK